jgi:Fe2+ or Zn2+ uptake regulation protein
MRQQRLSEATKGTGRSVTRQREAILELLRGTTSHPTAMQIFDQVRGDLPHITLATVYRNLAVLEELGLVQQLEAGTASAHFDAVVKEHCHVRCLGCGRVDDVHIADPENLDESAHVASGYTITGHHIVFDGYCQTCRDAQHTDQTN